MSSSSVEPPYYVGGPPALSLSNIGTRSADFGVPGGANDGNSPITAYVVTCNRMPGFGTGSSLSSVFMKNSTNPPSLNIVLTLHPGSDYICYSQAGNDIGLSNPSLTTTVTTLDERK